MLIVDVYNVLQTPGVLPPRLAGMDVPDLVDALARGRYRSRRLILVCDGVAGRGGARAELALTGTTIELLYSGPSDTADDLIESLLRRHARTTRVTVVSTDRRLRQAARRAGAEALRSDDFLRHLLADDALPQRDPLPAFVKDIPLDPGSVAHWLREFGYGAQDPRDLAAEMRRRREPRPAPPPRPSVQPPAQLPTKPTADQSPVPPAPSASPVPPAPPRRRTSPPAARTSPPAPPPVDDPLLRRALEEWRERLDPADLDMSRWIDGVRPLRPPGTD